MVPIRFNLWLNLGIGGFMACFIGTIVCAFILAVGGKVRPGWFIAIGMVFRMSLLASVGSQFVLDEDSQPRY